jgi:hypothetical protein
MGGGSVIHYKTPFDQPQPQPRPLAAPPLPGSHEALPPPDSEQGAQEPFALVSLPFDLYQRHKLVQEAVDRIFGWSRRLAILDVGGASGRLRAFFPRDRVVVVDREGQAGDIDARAEAFKLPFGDRAFDVVVSLDTLEHIAPRQRPVFLQELARVTRDVVMVAAPFAGPLVAEAESILEAFLQKRLKLEHRFLAEHTRHGLPDRNEVSQMLARSVGTVVAVPNGNLDRWLPMMALSFYLDVDPGLADLKRQVSAYYNRTYYRSDNSEPAYRYLLVARREPAPLFDPAGLGSREGETVRLDFSPMAVLMEVTVIDLLKEAYRSIEVLQGLMGSKDVHAANLSAELTARDERIANLEHHAANLEEIRADASARLFSLDVRFHEQIEYNELLESSLKENREQSEVSHAALEAVSREAAGLASHLRALRENWGVRLLKRLDIVKEPK